MEKNIKLLFAEDDPDTQKFYSRIFANEYNCKVTTVQCSKCAIEKLKLDKFDIVISDYNMPGGNGDKIFTHIKKSNLNIPFLFFTSEDISNKDQLSSFCSYHPCNEYISKTEPDELLSDFFFKFSILKSEFRAALNKRYVNIETKQLINFNSLPLDLFVQLSKTKHVKIYEKNNPLDEKLINKYYNKTIFPGTLAVKFDEFKLLKQSACKKLERALSLTNETIDSKIKTEALTFKYINNSLQCLGIDSRTIELAFAAYNSSIHNIKQVKDLYYFVDRLIKRTDYISQHSIMTFYIAYAICEKLGHNTQQIYQKMHLASLFHDSKLIDLSSTFINSFKNDNFENLSREEQIIFKNHPQDTADLLKNTSSIPPDIDKIVLEHHEQPDGSGFPKGLMSNNIGPLSCIFILAHDIADHLYWEGYEKKNVKKYLDSLSDKYSQGNFKNPFSALIKIFK